MSELGENGSKLDAGPAEPVEAASTVNHVSLLVARVGVLAGRHKWAVWLTGLMVLGFVSWHGIHHQWAGSFRNRLNAGLQTVADPSHLSEVLLVIAIAVVLSLWWLPKWQVAGSQGMGVENRFDRENEARKTLAQIVGGVFVLAGLYSSVKTFDLQHEGQITDRFTKAIDQLGALAPGGGIDKKGLPNPNMEVRLGGIFALERIAHDSPKDQWTIMEVLTAYIRENSRGKDYSEQAEVKHSTLGLVTSSTKPTYKPRVDIQAALTIIGRRDITHDSSYLRLDLSRSDLTGADLQGFHFEAANLQGSTLNKAHMSGIHLERALLNGTHLYGVELQTAFLDGAQLIGAQFDSRASLSGAQLNGAELAGANLDATDLMGAQCKKASFMGTYLEGAHLDGANLSDARFDGAHLDGAEILSAQLNGARLTRAHLDGAWLQGTDLSETKYLTQSQLAGTTGDKSTKLPHGLVPPDSWPK